MENLPIIPYRSFGAFYNGVAIYPYSIDTKSYLIVTTGRSYKILSLPDLKIKLLSPCFGKKITNLAAYNEFVLLTHSRCLKKMKFQHLVEKMKFTSDITSFYLLGKYLILTFKDKKVKLIHSGNFIVEVEFELNFVCEGILHPETYLNKVIFYSKKSMCLYNFNTEFMLFNYGEDDNISEILQNDEISTMVNSSSLDIISIGFKSGKIVALNLKTCEIYFEYKQSGKVESLDFTKRNNEEPFLLSCNASGNICIWNLNKNQLEAKINDFNQKINYIKFIDFENDELLLVASEEKNGLYIYKRDNQELKKYTLLRKREGAEHSLKKIKLYRDRFLIGLTNDPKGEMLKFSVFNDSGTLKFSKKVKKQNLKIQTELIKKTDNIENFVFAQNKIKIQDNCNLFTLHQNSQFPLFWDAENMTIKKIFLELYSNYRVNTDKAYKKKIEKFRINTCLDVSNCGHYLFLCFEDNIIIKMTSKRGKFISNFKDNLSELNLDDSIYFVFTDLLNNHVIAVSGKEVFKIDFYSGTILDRKKMDFVIKKAFYNKFINILVLSDNVNNLFVINTLNLEVVRVFNCEDNGEILDLIIAEKSKKIIFSTKNKKLIIWDIFLSEKTTEFVLEKNILSLSIDESKFILYSIFKNEKEITVWNIKNLNLTLSSKVEIKFKSFIQKLPKNPKEYYLLENKKIDSVLKENEDIDQKLIDEIKSIIDNDKKLSSKKNEIKLGDMPINKCRGIFHVERLEEQNKLFETNIEENENNNVPFFLDFGDSYLNKLESHYRGEDEDEDKGSRRVIRDYNKNKLVKERGDIFENVFMDFQEKTVFKKLSKNNKILDNLYLNLKELSPKEIDYYIKKNSLNSDNVLNFLVFLSYIFIRKNDYIFKIAVLKNILEVN